AARDLDQPRREPRAVRPASREPCLHVTVELEAALRVDREHLARAEAAATHRPPAGEVDGTRLRAAHDEPVRRGGEPERSQAVAVERRADDAAVGEDEAGGAV